MSWYTKIKRLSGPGRMRCDKLLIIKFLTSCIRTKFQLCVSSAKVCVSAVNVLATRSNRPSRRDREACAEMRGHFLIEPRTLHPVANAPGSAVYELPKNNLFAEPQKGR